MSPTAKMPGTFVRIRSSVGTKPRSTVTPCSSKPSPDACGPRPTATSSSSASKVLPFSSVTRTPPSVCSTPLKNTPVENAMPRLRNARSSALEHGLVLGGHEPGQRLDDRHLDAEGAPGAGELDADHAAAEHHRGRGHAVELQRVVAGDDALAVELETGERAGVGAGGEHDVAALVLRATDIDRRSARPAAPRPRRR